MGTPTGKRTVIFDLDGTLLDSSTAYFRAERSALREHCGITLTREEHDGCIGYSLAEMLERIVTERRPGVPVGPVLHAVQQHYLDELRRECRPFPGMRELVRCLHAAGHPLAVASGSPRKVIGTVLELLELTREFTCFVSSEEVAAGKPEPDVFRETARRMSARECVVVEDSWIGAEAARRAGIPCFLLRDVPDPATGQTPERPPPQGVTVVRRQGAEITGVLLDLVENL
ncbi:HAD family phosphatase [Streptomyces sp. HNM0574]|uniref:HAD family hydrolase n=1 Tax=Streptomyces sp. HNM0574 TaxID=2714954 RepID=UPI00146F4D19|nr:HAD family phosphatase [Streptomyces sp. HNM0574]NLU68388.1 HAD family phosphatase [Streptomyces sp. HNM0574]